MANESTNWFQPIANIVATCAAAVTIADFLSSSDTKWIDLPISREAIYTGIISFISASVVWINYKWIQKKREQMTRERKDQVARYRQIMKSEKRLAITQADELILHLDPPVARQPG